MAHDKRQGQLLADAEELLVHARPQRARRLSRRELAVESGLAAAVLLAAIAWPLLQPGGEAALSTYVICVLAYAAAAQVVLYVGAGCALATQLALVPMLWILPVPAVPLCVVIALLLGVLPDVLFRRHSYERLLMAVGDAAYVFAPAAVIAVGVPADHHPRWELVLLAFVLQCVFDAVVSTAREWLGRGIRPAVQLAVMGSVYGVDALLLPIAVAIADRAVDEPLVVLAVVPFSVLLGALARDRTRRLDDAVDRLEELERERHRVNVAIHRTGRSLGSSHDRVAMLEVALGTAVDAVAAAAGRARLVGAAEGMVFEAVPHQPGAAQSDALLEVERAALAGHPRATASSGGWHALGRPLLARRDGEQAPIGAIAVCRAGEPFGPGDDALFGYLVAQTAASIQSIDVHDRLQSQLALDGNTGLASRTRFQDVLRAEVERAQRARHPVALLVVQIDGLDDLTVRHGRELGEAVLQEAGAVLRARCRIVDEPARYRPGRIGVVLPATTLEAARVVGEDIRLGIAALALPWAGTTVRVTASVGIAALGSEDGTRERLLWMAEAALHEAERAGGDRTAVFGGRHTAERRSGS